MEETIFVLLIMLGLVFLIGFVLGAISYFFTLLWKTEKKYESDMKKIMDQFKDSSLPGDEWKKGKITDEDIERWLKGGK